MVWKRCAPSLPRLVREYVRELGQKDVAKGPNFYELELGLLAAQVDGKKVHVVRQRFSVGEGVRQIEKQSSITELPPLLDCRELCSLISQR
jgi:hypothetical protein